MSETTGSSETFSRVRSRIMVIDDEPIIVKRLETLLDHLGYTVTAFTDSEKALNALLAGERFDLIITDLKMRKNDGLKILATALSNDHEARVLVITGDGSWESISEAIGKGARGCIIKPFRIDDLKKAINHAIPPALQPGRTVDPRFNHNMTRSCNEKDAVNI